MVTEKRGPGRPRKPDPENIIIFSELSIFGKIKYLIFIIKSKINNYFSKNKIKYLIIFGLIFNIATPIIYYNLFSFQGIIAARFRAAGYPEYTPDMRLVIQDVMESVPSGDPIDGNYTSDYGWRRSMFGAWDEFHPGLDISVPNGTPIKATAHGQVVMSSFYGGYGLTVRIQHKYGFETIYAHCSRLAVQLGQGVYRGQVVAYSGQTGNVTGPHVHYEIRYSRPINREELQRFIKPKN